MNVLLAVYTSADHDRPEGPCSSQTISCVVGQLMTPILNIKIMSRLILFLLMKGAASCSTLLRHHHWLRGATHFLILNTVIVMKVVLCGHEVDHVAIDGVMASGTV